MGGDGILRALVIAPEPFFSPRGTPISVYHRAVVAGELGVELDLLTYGEGEDVAVAGLRIVRIPRFPMLGPVPTGPSLQKVFLDLFLLLWTVVLLLRRRYDFVHAHEEAVFFCLLLKPLFRFKLVYDMHSSLPEQLRNFGFTAARPATSAFRWLELRALRNADAVITICPELAAYAASQGLDADRHFLIENSLFEPVRSERAPDAAIAAQIRGVEEHLGSLPENVSLVVYAGTLEEYQGIDLLLAAFESLRARGVRAHLLVIGGDPDQRKHYEGIAKSLGILSDCRFTGRLPQEAAQSFCRRATLQVSSRTSGINTPLKLYEQLASEVPIVATRVLSHTQLLDESVAFLADPEPRALADALEIALRDRELAARKAASARRLYEQRYSRERYAEKMVGLLKRLT